MVCVYLQEYVAVPTNVVRRSEPITESTVDSTVILPVEKSNIQASSIFDSVCSLVNLVRK
jgi:hypothetical protein